MNRSIQVIKIINDRLILINAGSDDGITREDTFGIFQEGVEIIDPISCENLGVMDFMKAKIEIHTLYPKMTLCRNATIEFAYPFQSLRGIPKGLNINPEDISGGFDNNDRVIHIGDLVRKN